MEEKTRSNQQTYSYTQKIWIAAGIVALLTVLLLLFKATFNVLLLLFAGILIAVYFRGFSGLIQRKTKWNETFCVVLSVLGTLLLISGFFWLIGAQIQTQFEQLSDTLPKTIEHAKSQLRQSSIGSKLVDKATSEDSIKKLQSFAGGFFSSTLGVFGDLYVVLFVGIFLTVSPQHYTGGLLELVPPKGRKKAQEVFSILGEQLKNWLKGKLFSMFVVFLLTAIGLLILGIPLWLVLALLAGFLSFIPNFGPLIALTPAVLVGLLDGTQTALLVAGLYMLVQFLESNFITPFVQQKMVSVPPALVISAQMIVGSLTGGWGLLLSTPLTVVLIVLTKQLYIKDQSSESRSGRP